MPIVIMKISFVNTLNILQNLFSNQLYKCRFEYCRLINHGAVKI